jgi:hypothetical protein
VANFTVLRPGQINGAGSTDALFLKLFAGEVLTQFHAKNISQMCSGGIVPWIIGYSPR